MLSAFITELKTEKWPFSDKAAPSLHPDSRLPLIEQKAWLRQARLQGWEASKGLHWPSLDLSLQYQQSLVRNLQDRQWVGLLSISLPLWSQLETSSQISSAYADYLAAENDFRDTEQSLTQRTLFLKEKVSVVRENLVDAKTNLEKARRLYQEVLRSFRLGRISTNDLFIEQNRLFDSETALAQSQLSYHQTLIETCALAGRTAKDCLN